MDTPFTTAPPTSVDEHVGVDPRRDSAQQQVVDADLPGGSRTSWWQRNFLVASFAHGPEGGATLGEALVGEDSLGSVHRGQAFSLVDIQLETTGYALSEFSGTSQPGSMATTPPASSPSGSLRSRRRQRLR